MSEVPERHQRCMELIRAGLVPSQIFTVMRLEGEERKTRAKATYDAELQADKITLPLCRP